MPAPALIHVSKFAVAAAAALPAAAPAAAPIMVPLVPLPISWPAMAPRIAPPATFFASVPFDELRTRSANVDCTVASSGYVRLPYVTDTNFTVNDVWSFEPFAVFASTTANVPVAPSGITIPFVAVTDAANDAVNCSPTATVLLHTLVLAAKRNDVPDATTPVMATGAGVGAGVGDGADGLVVAVRRGFGAVGIGGGGAAGATTGGGAAGTSCSVGWAESVAIAKSRPRVLSAFRDAVSAALPPQAASAASENAAKSIVGRDARIY